MAAKRERVLAVGLDSAEIAVVEEYIAHGYLPTLSRLKRQGASCRLENFDLFSAETPWTTFATGRSPRSIGYWSPLKFDANRYRMSTLAAYDYAQAPPFFALGDGYRVSVFDVPHVRVVDGVSGIQVGAWGAHSPQVPPVSAPAGLRDELIARHGAHPGLHDDYAECLNLKAVEDLRGKMATGIRRRGDICVDLLRREPWDLFLTVFGEPHTAGHNMWQVSRPDHPLYGSFAARLQGDPMREVYEAIDFALARMIDAAGPDVNVVAFSAHGMGPNTMDLPSIAFLPELMFRLNFPGHKAIGVTPGPGGQVGAPVPPPVLSCLRDSWIWEVWSQQHDPRAWRRLLRQHLPWGALRRLQGFMSGEDLELATPFGLRDAGIREVPFQPASWFMPLWPRMRAFALPSFSEGYVRVNVRGREAHGLVEPEDYARTCDEIEAMLRDLRDARSGEPMVRKVQRMRRDPMDSDPTLPDADIVVGWQERYATDTVDSPTLGRIGPLPHFRAGSHRSEGFVYATGPRISQGIELPRAHALDLPPTLLALLGAPIASDLEGKPISLRPSGATERIQPVNQWSQPGL